MTYIATESIEWCIARCERETNPFSQIAEAQLIALKGEDEGLKTAAIEVINTLRLKDAAPMWPLDENRRIEWNHHEAVAKLRDALGQGKDTVDSSAKIGCKREINQKLDTLKAAVERLLELTMRKYERTSEEVLLSLEEAWEEVRHG